MIFNSLDFLFFAILFFILWPFLKRNKNSRWGYLVLASFLFYGWWDYRFLALIIASGLLDFICGLGMIKFSQHKKKFLYLSIIGNIGSLAIFKYLNFGIEAYNDVAGLLNSTTTITPTSLILPIGISFYTFQSMSYTIDIYKGKLKPTNNILHFFAYLSMFPQLVAGPIVRASDLLIQLEHPSEESWDAKWEGTQRILRGLFKKMVIADNLAPAINAAFSSATISDNPIIWWIIIAMFSLQIYCDFSGYSDIAEGLARWMGYSFPRNFNHPYISTSIQEFWTRWHISLSTWFRDYVYIPLGGSRDGQISAQRNMWITMLLSGFWHGASWNFIIWGALHSTYLTIERITKWPERCQRHSALKFFGWLVIMIQIMLAWVFFRATSFEQAITIVQTMLTPTFNYAESLIWVKSNLRPVLAMSLMSAWHIVWFKKWHQSKLLERSKLLWQPIAIATLVIVIILFRGTGNAFIYFQF